MGNNSEFSPNCLHEKWGRMVCGGSSWWWPISVRLFLFPAGDHYSPGEWLRHSKRDWFDYLGKEECWPISPFYSMLSAWWYFLVNAHQACLDLPRSSEQGMKCFRNVLPVCLFVLIWGSLGMGGLCFSWMAWWGRHLNGLLSSPVNIFRGLTWVQCEVTVNRSSLWNHNTALCRGMTMCSIEFLASLISPVS